jgi:hypothetical protein
MAMQRYFDVVQNRQGTAVVGATVTVYDSNGNLATLYSNNSNAATSNPVYTNADGEYAFYAANGTYTIQIAATGYAGETKPGVVLFDPLDAGIVSVKDFGARGDGVTDDTAAIQAAITACANKTLSFPSGNYKVTATINVNIPIYIKGEGTSQTFVTQHTNNIDTFRFAPTTAGVSSAFLSGARIENINVSHTVVAATSTQGAGVRFLQCNGYRLFQVNINNAPEGLTIQGGQLGSLKSFGVFASSGLVSAPDTALLLFRSAPVGASFQPCYTVEVEDFRLSASKLRESCIYVRSSDGLHFVNGYVAFGEDRLVTLQPENANDYVGILSFANVYFDCVGAGNTKYGFVIPNNARPVIDFTLGNGCTIANGEIGILSAQQNLFKATVTGATFANLSLQAIQIQGSAATTDVLITGCQIYNIGSGGGAGACSISDTKSIAFNNNILSSFTNSALNLSGGNVGVVSIVGNISSSNVPDVLFATVLGPFYLRMTGNSSIYSADPTKSWANPNLGYLVGASVTQGSGSGKATSVIIDSLTGKITTDADSLSANTVVRFDVNNSTIKPNDTIIVNRLGGGSASSYQVWCDRVISGLFSICIRNITGGALAEAIVIQFSVIRGAQA